MTPAAIPRMETLQDGATSTGNGTAMRVWEYGSVGLQITGTFTATIQFEGSVDGQNWHSINAFDVDENEIVQSTENADLFIISAAGLSSIRARISSYTSGNVTVVGRGVPTASGLDPIERNREITVFDSAQRDTDQNSSDQVNNFSPRALIFLDITDIGGTSPSLTMNIQAKDPASGNYYTIGSLSGVSSTGTKVMGIGPSVGDAKGSLDTVSDVPLPRRWRIQIDVDTADGDETYTYSVGVSYSG